MNWTPAPPDAGCRSVDDCDYKFSLSEVSQTVFSIEPRPIVVFPREVRDNIIQHLSSKSTELGGLLFGAAFTAGAELANAPMMVQITNSIESQTYQSTGVSLRMDTEIWDRAKPFLENQEIVVGWYHSHPNLGAFFSGIDRQNQAAVFHHPYSLGLVIDPIRHEEKWFVGKDSIGLPPELVRANL